ncbi:MAG: ABC-2 family transporter protein [Planctomycetes bacterium]|nr:ABC-2 family transporter protein [Planctomycetota bacterium]
MAGSARDLGASALRHLRLAGLYAVQMAKTRLEYRGDLVVECAASLLSQACGLAVVGIIFESVPLLRGWSRPEVFFIYGFALTAQALFEAVADGFYWFADKYVIRGELDRILLRPANPLFQVLLENLSFEFLADLALGLSILGLASAALERSPGPGDWALLLVMVPSAVLVLSGLFLALASVSFWAEDKVGVLPPVYNLMAFGRYPLTIYHPALRALLSWVLPYGFVAFYPSTGFLGRAELSAYFWGTPAAGLVTFAVGYQVFRAGLRRYRSTGS